MAGKKRAYCKNTVSGHQRGKKYPEKVKTEVLMAMLGSNSICAVAQKYRIPESTIRSWLAAESEKSDAFAKQRQAVAREIAIRASLGVRAQVGYLQGRAQQADRAAQICEKLNRRLDEAVRAQSFEIGALLKSDGEELSDALQTGLSVYGSLGSRDRRLYTQELEELYKQLERYRSQTMTDRDAATIAKVLMDVSEQAAGMQPAEDENGSEAGGEPLIRIAAEDYSDENEVVLDDKGGE